MLRGIPLTRPYLVFGILAGAFFESRLEARFLNCLCTFGPRWDIGEDKFGLWGCFMLGFYLDVFGPI